MDMNLSKLWEIVKDREVGLVAGHGVERVGHDLATEQRNLLRKRRRNWDKKPMRQQTGHKAYYYLGN